MDLINYRSEKAKEIVKVVSKLKFVFVLVSDQEYALDGYKLISLVNRIAGTKELERSLINFEKIVRKSEKIKGLPDFSKPYGGFID